MSRICHQLLRAAGIAWAIFVFSQPAHADARTTFLINMLEGGGNYRIRVQAATTLGKLRSKEAVPALVRALEDSHELVVISAVTALGQIGDASVIPQVEQAARKAPSRAAKSQIEATLRILRAVSSQRPGQRPAVSGRPRFFVRVDAMGNSSGVKQEDILDRMRNIVVDRLTNGPGVVLQAPGLDRKAVQAKLKKERLAGYIISGSLIRMERMGDRIVVKLGLNVFTNPDYNLLMMPTAQGAVQVAPGDNSEETERRARERAMRSVVSSLVTTVFDELKQLKRP